jgi:hypothetical protein
MTKNYLLRDTKHVQILFYSQYVQYSQRNRMENPNDPNMALIQVFVIAATPLRISDDL